LHYLFGTHKLRGISRLFKKVQKWAARIPTEFRNLSYEERLEKWELTKLSERRLRKDLIQMYKILKNHDEISWVRDPRENLYKNTYEKRENFENDLSLVRERFSAKNSNSLSLRGCET
jgi:hypothetical protein